MGEEKKKILVVDDEKEIAGILKMRLEASGYGVIVAYDGNAGYAMAKNDSPDLLILDLTLPGMDGYQVCRLLKFDPKYSRTPIIMLTSRSQKEDREWGEKVGADAYFTKPYEAKELLDKIKELLGRKNA